MPSVVGQLTKGAAFDKLVDTVDLAGTAHRLLYTGADGVVNELGYGAAGDHLKSEGASSAPTWEAPPAGGGDVTAAANITATSIVVGDDGAKGVKDTGILVDGSNNLLMPGAAHLEFRSGFQYIHSSFNGLLDLTSTVINLNGIVSVAVGSPLHLGGVGQTISSPSTDNLTIASADILLDGDVRVTGAFGIPDTDDSHHLLLDAGSNLTADRVLSFVTGDAARTLTLTGDATLNQDVSTVGTPAFEGVTLADNKKLILGTGGDAEVYYDGGNLIIDPKAAGSGYVDVQGSLFVNGATMAIGDVAPSATLGFGVALTGASIATAIIGNITYTGAGTIVRGLSFTVFQQTSSVQNVITLGVDALAKLDMDVAAARTGTTRGGFYQADVIEAQTNASQHIVYGVQGAASALAGKHTDGDFYIASVYGQAPFGAGGSPNSSTEWAGLFGGDVQINSGKKLILEGSTTAKGDTYIVFQNSRIEFFLDGTLEGYVDGNGFVST